MLCSCLLWRAIEFEDALHWLSTLGGAFSNLGEGSYNFVSEENCLAILSRSIVRSFDVHVIFLQALRAGENALSQMRLVLNFSYGQRNPAVIAKCWLFVAMSLMQQV